MIKWVLLGALAILLFATFGCYSPNPENEVFYLQLIPQDGIRLFKPPESLGWRATNDANYYMVEVSSDRDFNNIVFKDDVDALAAEENLLAGERWYRVFVPKNTLSMNKNYYWRVRVVFNDNSSRYSTPTSFILGYPVESR